MVRKRKHFRAAKINFGTGCDLHLCRKFTLELRLFRPITVSISQQNTTITVRTTFCDYTPAYHTAHWRLILKKVYVIRGFSEKSLAAVISLESLSTQIFQNTVESWIALGMVIFISHTMMLSFTYIVLLVHGSIVVCDLKITSTNAVELSTAFEKICVERNSREITAAKLFSNHQRVSWKRVVYFKILRSINEAVCSVW